MNAWVPVSVPVEAKVGPVYLRLFPYESVPEAPEHCYERPYCWGAMCRVTFRFGRFTTTKRLTQRFTYLDNLGLAVDNRPSDAALDAGRETVIANLRHVIEQHGIEVDALEVIGEDA